MKLTKKKTNYLLLTIIVGFLTTFVILPSCKKDKPDTNPDTGGGSSNCDDIQNVKKYFAFKVGSWWVYEEENSKARDSVYVTEYANDPSNYNFDVRMYSSYQDYYYHFWPVFASGSNQCVENGKICLKCSRIKRSKYKPGDYIDEDVCFFWIAKKGDYETLSNPVDPNDKLIIEEVYENYSIGTINFEKTFKVYEINTYMEGRQPSNHYFTEGVGLIRKELLDSNKIWNLVDYHIEN